MPTRSPIQETPILIAKLILLTSLAVWVQPSIAQAQFIAEQVTPANAANYLFQGSDADGGVDDWYLSNGVVEVIVDDVGVQSVPGGAIAPPKQSEIAFTGGTIIDLGLVGSDNDQLSQMFSVGGLSTSNFVVYDSIDGASTANSASITVTGNLLGFDPDVPPSDLAVTTEFTVEETNPYVTITTTIVNNHATNAAEGLGGLLDVFAWVTRAIVPFSPLPDRGFNHAVLDFSNLGPALELPMFAAGPGNLSPDDGVMDPPTGAVAGEVSYGLLGVEVRSDPDASGPIAHTVTPVDRLFGISNNLITAFGNLPAPMLDPGASLAYERRVYVGAKNDVASVADLILPDLATRLGFTTGTISGDVNASDDAHVQASAVVTRVAGPPIVGLDDGSATTHFRTDEDGAFSDVVLPTGTYDIVFKSPERDDVSVSGVVVTDGADTEVSVPFMTGRGFVAISISERVKGVGRVPVPGRVTFVGTKGTPNPRFGHDFEALQIAADASTTDLIPESFAGGLAQHNYAYTTESTSTIAIRPGTYKAYVSRGPEYNVKIKKFRIKEGKTKNRRAALRRIVPTSDALSADFHVHSGRSFDTSPPLTDRVVSFAAENVEVLVSTDHDYHTDYAPIIADLGLDGITSIIGNEVTGSVPNPPAFPDSIGHINAWPLSIDPIARRDGSIEDEFVAPNLLFSRLRDAGADVIQYNHPRAGVAGITSIGFFNNFGYDPSVSLSVAPNDLLLNDDIFGPGQSGVANPDGFRNLDFDCMEIMNEVSIESYLEMRRDWFSLLNQYDGTTVPFIGGTSVSDSHRLSIETPGYGRTYVLGLGDDPAALDVATMSTNIKAGKMVGTTGPFIELAVSDATGTTVGLGDTLVPNTSEVDLSIKVLAAHWIPVDEVRIYVNGFLHTAFDSETAPSVSNPKRPTSRSKETTRFESSGEISLELGEDSWIIVEAGQKLVPTPTPHSFTDIIVPGLESVAFTNPVFVDLGGDGFDPPGLPVEGASILRAPGRASLETLDLDSLSEHKRHQVTAHPPFHKLRIPPSAVESLRQ